MLIMYVLFIIPVVVLALLGIILLWWGVARKKGDAESDSEDSKQPTVVLCGILLLALATCLGATLIWARTQNVDWNTIKPASWLVSEAKADGKDKATQQAILTLIDRMATGKLVQHDVAGLVDHYLQVQADPAQSWANHYGLFIEATHRYELLDDDSWKRYVRQAISLSLETRKRVRVGGRIPIRIDGGFNTADGPGFIRSAGPQSVIGIDLVPRQYALGPMQLSWNQLKTYYQQDRIGPLVFEHGSKVEPVKSGLPTAPPHTETPRAPSPAGLVGAKAGDHEMKLSYNAVAYNLNQRDAPIIDSWVIELKAKLQLVEADQSPVELLRDPGQAQLVRDAISIRPIQLSAQGPDNSFTMPYRLLNLPVDIYFKVSIRAGDREAPVGFMRTKPSSSVITTSGRYIALQSGDTVDVILKPAPFHAERTLDIDTIWGEDIIIEKVPVK
jgi:hypothetical protein